MKTIKLVVEYDYEFELVGLISSLKGHKLAWTLNNELKIELKKEEDICIDFLHEGQLVIINYNFETEHSNFRLIKNKSCEFANIASPYLIPELKEYDYFIQVKDESGFFNISEVIEKLKNINGVEYMKIIETENLKSKDNLIF
jgi:hypothetical protein